MSVEETAEALAEAATGDSDDDPVAAEHSDATAPPDAETVEGSSGDAGAEPDGGADVDAAGRESAGQQVDEIAGSLAALARSVEDSIALEQRHLGVIEKLHGENAKLRQGELTLAMKPLLLDIVRVHDSVEALVRHGGDALASVLEMIVDLLDRHGVTRVTPGVRTPFDPKMHLGTGVIETLDPGPAGTVAAVTRSGFVRDGIHIIRPAQVQVYRHVAPVPDEPAAAAPTTEP